MTRVSRSADGFIRAVSLISATVLVNKTMKPIADHGLCVCLCGRVPIKRTSVRDTGQPATLPSRDRVSQSVSRRAWRLDSGLIAPLTACFASQALTADEHGTHVSVALAPMRTISPDALPIFLTPADVAVLLRTSRKAIYALIERRQLPGVTRIGRRVLVRSATLLDWLGQQGASSQEA
jgi:excisionase family DNA binding protein